MLSFFIGLAVAVLSGLGIGGGGLLVIYLVLILGKEQLEAQSVNLVYFLFSSSAAMLVHLIKRKLPWKLIGWMILFGAVGALIGSFAAKATDPGIVRKCFGGLLIVSGTLALFKKQS